MGTDVEIRLVDMGMVERIRPAIEDFVTNGDPSRVKALVTEASKHVLHDGSSEATVAAYLADASFRVLNGNLPQNLTDERSGRILSERADVRGYLAQRSINRFLVFELCTRMPDGSGALSIGRGGAGDFLRARSKWLDDVLSLSNEFLWEAEVMGPSLGYDAWLLTAEESNQLLQAIQACGKPMDGEHVRRDYDQLLGLFETASHASDRRILVTMF
jgi:hypothetical protein